jgi:hypothetical protein
VRWGRLGRPVQRREGADLRRREEARFIEYTRAQQAAALASKGARERDGVSLTMARDEGRRDELDRRKKDTLSQVVYINYIIRIHNSYL